MRGFLLHFWVSFAVSALLSWALIAALRGLYLYQNLKRYGPERHLREKVGTPTAGGVVFALVLLAFALLELPRGGLGPRASLLVGGSLAFSAVGFLDDLLKWRSGTSEGLTERGKFALQCLVAVALALFAAMAGLKDRVVLLPSWDLELAGDGFPKALGLVVSAFVLVGTVNAVNIADGLDGLAAGGAILSLASLLLLGGSGMADLSDLSPHLWVVLGSLMAFLAFNWHPAMIFMGDVGSHFLGGVLAISSFLLSSEWLLPFLGGLFLWDTASVLLQRLSLALFSRRIFLMSPFHHHFELKGYSELSIVSGFLLCHLASCVAGILLFWRVVR